MLTDRAHDHGVATTPLPAPTPHADAATRNSLFLYRLLASFPALGSYRAKLFVVASIGTLLPLFLVVVALVLGAGRMPVMSLIVLLVVFFGLGLAACLWALDRLTVPLEVAADALDAYAERRDAPPIELPGGDEMGRVARGIVALTGRLRAADEEKARLAERDELTGLLHRRAGRSRAQPLIDAAAKIGNLSRVVFADVDAFRVVNEARGSGFGDSLLKSIAGRLADAAGSAGLAMRWNGDQFVVVLTGPAESLPRVDEHMARAIVVKGLDAPVTLSIGVAETNERASFEALVAQAEAMVVTRRENQRRRRDD